MNYLAHIFLSGKNRHIQFGNFIGDAVKGSDYNKYPDKIREGILLHRKIDEFTDNHEIVKSTILKLKPHFGRYSAVILDIYFDYLLASRFKQFSDRPLKRFARRFYWTITTNRRYLPERMRGFMWHFIGTNRLCKYATKEGIRRALEIMVMVGKIRVPIEDRAIDYLTNHEDELMGIFSVFFGDLRSYTASLLSEGELQ